MVLRLAVPAWTPPSPRTLVEKYAPIISQDVHDVVKAKLESASFLTLTSDGWKRNRMFLNSVVVCTPDPVLIGVYRAEEREDGAYLRELLQRVLDGDVLAPHKDKVAAIVTDNGSAIRSAREMLAAELRCLSLRCAAHGVNLAASDVLRARDGPVAGLLQRVRKLVKALRVAPVVKELNKRGALTARLDNDTRWNSTLDMMQRALKLRDVAKDIAQNGILLSPDISHDIVNNALFWDELEGVVGAMQPLAEWQDAVQRDSTNLADLFHEYTKGYGLRARTKAAALRGHPS